MASAQAYSQKVKCATRSCCWSALLRADMRASTQNAMPTMDKIAPNGRTADRFSSSAASSSQASATTGQRNLRIMG